MAELKDKITKSLLTLGGIEKPRVLRCRPVAGRYLVYLSSPSFSKMKTLTRQKLIVKALEGDTSELSSDEKQKVALVRTFTVREGKSLRALWKERKLKLKMKKFGK